MTGCYPKRIGMATGSNFGVLLAGDRKGLNPDDKAGRVASYAHNLMHEVAVIAHSCGVLDPSELTREHAQIINEQGLPEPLADAFPPAEILPQYRHLV